MEKNKSHSYFYGTKNFSHKYKPASGILLLNLGTPEAPTAKALRVYLREFLNDSRIIELPRFFWKSLLELIILRTRPAKVAKLYQSIWTEEGSPLLVYSKSIAQKLEKNLRLQNGNPIHVAIGMRYGTPSVRDALRELKSKGCNRIMFIPLFGQYSSTTVGSGFDALASELMKWRWVPDIRTIHYFHDNPGYIKALAENVRKHWEENGRGEKLLMSFHGVPVRYIMAGDPYHCHCHKTARLLAEELGLEKDQYYVSFQSQFGREEWIKPKTDKTLVAWAKAGMKAVDVICPGFIVDCLETIEEIAVENRDNFLENGGEKYNYIASLNDQPNFIEVLESLVLENGADWFISREEWNEEKFTQNAEDTEKRYKAMLSS